MESSSSTMAQQVAKAASDFQRQCTGVAPGAVTVALSDHTLVITLQGALSAAEMALAQTAAGALQVQEFHRQLFASSCGPLRQEIKRITGVEVHEAAVELETSAGAVVHVFTSGTMVQVFLLAKGIPAAAWNGDGPAEKAHAEDHASAAANRAADERMSAANKAADERTNAANKAMDAKIALANKAADHAKRALDKADDGANKRGIDAQKEHEQ